MPLVPTATYQAWYSKQSWVYSAFRYLFVNPLWTTRVPSACSLCIYWWSALFSILVFRPIVYLTLGVAQVVKALHLGAAVKSIDQIAKTILCRPNDDAPPVLPTVLLLCVLAIIGGASWLGWFIVTAYAEVSILSALFLPAVLLVTFIATTVYSTNHYGDNRCPVEVYTRIIAALCIALSAILHPAGTFEAFVLWPLDLVTSVLGLFWWALSTGGVLIGGWLWSGVKWTLSFLPWMLGLAAVLGAYGWFAVRFMSRSDPITPSKVEVVSPAERRRRLKELAVVCCYYDTYSDTNRSWWTRILNGYLASLEAFLTAPTWDAFEVRRAKQVELENLAYEAIVRDREARARRDAKCRAVTTKLVALCTPFTFVWKQSRILCSYLWQWAKARKSGSCPYLTFHD